MRDVSNLSENYGTNYYGRNAALRNKYPSNFNRYSKIAKAVANLEWNIPVTNLNQSDLNIAKRYLSN